MRHRSLLTALAAAALLSLTLAGCSGEKAAAKLDPAESPLSKYMSSLYEGFDENDGIAQQNEQEELVAACMAAEGFDYTPADASQYSGMASDSGEEYGTEKWVAENGYGMSQSPEQLAAQQEESEAYVDPNQDYVMSLSEGEQAAYNEVLYGPQPTEEELADGSYIDSFETKGCYGSASQEIFGDQPSQEDHAAVYDAMSLMYEDLQASPAIVKLDAEWASCMADAGYATFAKKADAQESIMDAQNALYEDQSGTAPDETILADLREKELVLAMADFTCAEDVNYTEATTKVQFELEEQFITDHKSELDALIADSEQGK
ncbi:hypothetical protein E3T39_06005 [Cryobacterium suzukii]|uniref:Uncharacterized protein n=1 Tax=Cryobacterium suzukii TaxID=1259198 RepID=A0A4R9AHC5_9MICO|nr:hypothetical protein [Cryobacterium suzukii]TFD61593.1 hypothetical protein E3T39_06005 [Cryobacterium suzukii]